MFQFGLDHCLQFYIEMYNKESFQCRSEQYIESNIVGTDGVGHGQSTRNCLLDCLWLNTFERALKSYDMLYVYICANFLNVFNFIIKD